jgi:hypothetical protein
VEEQKQKDEELKTKIFDIYLEYHESSSNRNDCLLDIWEHVIPWCRYYLFPKETQELIEKEGKNIERKTNEETGLKIFKDEMSVEIYKAVKGCVEKEKMPKKEFFSYLYVALVNAKNEYFDNCINDLTVSEPIRLKKSKKEINNMKKMWEKEIGRKITQDEFVSRYAVVKQISKEKARTMYLESMDIKLIRGHRTVVNEDGDELSILNNVESHYLTPEKEANYEENVDVLKNKLETLLNKYDDKEKPFYRALLTTRMIINNKNIKNNKKLLINEKIMQILDEEIIRDYEKDGKIQTQSEMYMNYYTNKIIEKKSAESGASPKAKEFFACLDKIEEELYEKLGILYKKD